MAAKSFLELKRHLRGALIVLCMIILQDKAWAQGLCQNIFNSENPYYGYTKGTIEATLQQRYADSFTEYRNSFFSSRKEESPKKGIVISKYYPFETSSKEELRAETHQWKFRPDDTMRQTETGGHNYEEFIAENIEFVLRQYANRRAWSGEFREHLYGDALKYASQSEYFLVRGYPQLRGTLKLVQVDPQTQEKHLPMEEYLKIELSSNHGLKIEPSNFAILKDQNKVVFPELLLRFVAHAETLAKTGKYDLDKPVFFTYGDAISVRLYQTMGFHFVEKKLDSGGVEWNILQASLRDIIELPNNLKKNLHTWSAEEQAAFNNFLSIYSAHKEETAQNVWTNKGRSLTTKNYNPELSFSLSEEHVYKGNSVKLLQFYNRKNSEKLAVNFLVPSSNNKIQSSFKDGNKDYSLSMEKQILHYEKDYKFFKIRMTIYFDETLARPLRVVFEKVFEPSQPNFVNDEGANEKGQVYLVVDYP